MKLSWKDRAAQISVLILAGLILFGIDAAADRSIEAAKLSENAAGIAYQAIGFLLVLWATKTKIRLKANTIAQYEGDKSRVISAITHPKSWETGIMLILMGLFFQFIGLDWSPLEGIGG